MYYGTLIISYNFFQNYYFLLTVNGLIFYSNINSTSFVAPSNCTKPPSLVLSKQIA